MKLRIGKCSRRSGHYQLSRVSPFKQYRLDRIIRMSGTVDIFRRDPDFDIECFAKFAFGSFFSVAEHGLVRRRPEPPRWRASARSIRSRS